MAQALNKTKRRIASVKSTKKITEAMELVATVKLRKYKNIMEKNQFYVKEMENVISHLFGALNAEEEIPYLHEGKGNPSSGRIPEKSGCHFSCERPDSFLERKHQL